ncbi:hypothetical protein EUV02_04870 [Polymorphobacter arshaanensis]|uniref:Uncharacterized protein n=1 Tax=Glacieibacterium arshaanense TaxID=2511025 RepID=A0A4Y9ETU0_9SPHN|nr:hypothetical protein [Polymorphobacter arshaanensis]TFU06328.1 hypothetical protein EUV02_04870 [Polymorphobacter arshaanensis]
MTGIARHKLLAWPLVLVIAVAAVPAQAYAGPGAGLSMIGSLVALIGAVFAGIFGFIWFPIKRLLKKRKAGQAETALPPTKPNETQR